MAEISNGTLALLVLAALAVVVTTTTLQLSGGLTGYSVDSGQVQLEIASNLQIEVTEGLIDFGQCTPNATSAVIVNSNNTIDESNGQCTGGTVDLSTTAQRIKVENIGNQDASVSVEASCPISSSSSGSFIPAPSGEGQFNVSVYSETAGDCTGGSLSDWTPLGTSPLTVCSNFQNTTGGFFMPAAVSIPSDAQQGGTCSTNTITFTAS